MKKIVTYFFITAAITTLSCSEDRIEGTGEGTLTGTVVAEATNEPIENVKITTTPASTTVFTDENGAFVIDAIANDDYSVKAELEGYVTAFEAANIIVGETSNVVFELITSEANNKSPLAPNLLTPVDGATDVPSQVDFIWSSSSNDNDDLTYTLEVRNGSSSTVETYEVVNDTMFSVDGLALGTSYFWRVSVKDELNAEVRSAVSQFSTLATPTNRFLFTRMVNGNSVIFSGEDNGDQGAQASEFKLTSENYNSFRPKKNVQVNKIAFLRTTGEGTHLYTMGLDGNNVARVTSSIPVNGFRIGEVNFTWAENGSKIYYPNFDKLYSIDPDGGGATLIYQTGDGSFISEVSTSDINPGIIALKTNDFEGYGVRVYTVDLQTGLEQNVILSGVNGAVSGIDLKENLDMLIYSYDTSASQNNIYRRFKSRLFVYDFNTMTAEELETDVDTGDIDVYPQWSPTEGEVIFTRRGNNVGSTPSVYVVDIDNNTNNTDRLYFSNASQPNWE